MVAEEVPENDDARTSALECLGKRALVDLEQAELGTATGDERGGDAGEEVRTGAVPREPPLGAQDLCSHGCRRGLAVRRGDERHAVGSRAASASTAPWIDLPQDLPGQRRPASTAYGTRQRSDRARSARSRLPVGRHRASVPSGEEGRGCSERLAENVERSKLFARMARPRSPKRASVRIDEAELAAFRAGLRRRYTDQEILDELRAAAERAGRSPTMREFAKDPEARVHPQTVIEHFGTWNAAKRAAGLFPRRFLTREELLEQLRALGEELGRTPTARDLAARRRALPSASLYAHTFGSLGDALREAGFEVLRGEERLERAIEQGAALAVDLGRLPKMADWAEARRANQALLSEWQVYRMLDVPRGAWTAFQYLVRERLRGEGLDVLPDGSLRSAE